MKILKIFVIPEIETFVDPVNKKFVSNLQSHLTHNAEVIFGA